MAGGRLIVDVEPLQSSAGPEPLAHWQYGDDLITLTCHPGVNPPERCQLTWGRYELWREGRLVRTELEPFTLQRYDLDEFTGLLRAAGFTTITVHADYQAGQPPTAQTRVWTIEATAP